MARIASFVAVALLVIGFASGSQAGGASSVTCTGDFVIVACQIDPDGNFTVFAISDSGNDRPAPGFDLGDDCTKALGVLENHSGNPEFVLREASSGSTDRTIYTWSRTLCSFN